MLRQKVRAVGARAELARTGAPSVTSATGGKLDVVTGASQPGFNPLDLLYASLSACIVLSARIAASERGVLDKIEEIVADVTGEKAHEGLSRVEKFDIKVTIRGDLDPALKAEIAEAAENQICTIGNTLRSTPIFSAILAD